jgi:phosphoribosylanthranilate isomerase
VLLDSHVEGFGGGGKVFDWSIIPKELAPRVVLSGGLTVHNVSGALALVRPCAVDISSGVEQSKGVKDHEKMHTFIALVKQFDGLFPSATNYK